MKLQCSSSTILLITAFVAISCSGMIWFATRIGYPNARPDRALFGVFTDLISFAPMWTPLVFAGYAIGRRRLSARMVLAFIAAEIGSLVAAQITLLFIRGY